MTSTIGFIGLGNMGAPMVRCLVRNGFSVVGYDAKPGAAAALAAEPELSGHVTAASTLTDVACAADIVITMLPDSKIVRHVVLGPDGHSGLAATWRPNTVLIDMSSSYPLDTRKLAEKLKPSQISVVDAPVSGGVGKAITGTLAIMTGGAAATIDRVQSILSAMGTVHRTGDLGSGHAIKALNNYVSAAGLLATCEALLVAEKFGLDSTVATKVINASTGRNNTTENKADRYLIPRKYDSGFALALMDKDVGMARTLASDLGIVAENLDFVSSQLGRALKALGKEADHTAVMQFIEASETTD
ncbi:MAG: NAD(P)-dependent oxidoreductase [Hyphomicrobiaceae bacterium]